MVAQPSAWLLTSQAVASKRPYEGLRCQVLSSPNAPSKPPLMPPERAARPNAGSAEAAGAFVRSERITDLGDFSLLHAARCESARADLRRHG